MAIVLIVFSNLFRTGEFRNAVLLLGAFSLCSMVSALFFKNEKKREVKDIVDENVML